MSEDVAIKVEHVTKTFKLPHEKHSSVKSALINFRKRGFEKQIVLKDISFEVRKGEFFGIVGRNGSGKSTLLKLLAGIYMPSKGIIDINGKLTPFIELGVGFNPELSGRDNVFLNGALLGFSRKEMALMYDDIVAFAELERFMDQKLKNYSSGMQVRLAFSIAIRANTDILVLDEVLAVGDVNFQRKCLNYFKQLKSNKKTVIFVSHDMGAVQDFCDKVLIIDKGEIYFEGDSKEAAALYNSINFSNSHKSGEATSDKNHYGDGSVSIQDLHIVKKNGSQNYLEPYEKFSIELRLKANKTIKSPLVGIQIEDISGNVVFSYNNLDNNEDFSLEKNEKSIFIVELENIFHNGTYTLSAAVKSQDKLVDYDQALRVGQFEISGWNVATAFVHSRTKTTYKRVGR